MLTQVVRHGFVFWEAARSTKPPFEERARLSRQEMRLKMAETAVEILNGTCTKFPEEPKLPERHLRWEARNRYNRKVWGNLAELSDELPPHAPEVVERSSLKPKFNVKVKPSARTEEAIQELDRFMIHRIQERVMEAFGISREDFFGANGNTWTRGARAVSMMLCRERTFATGEAIARAHERTEAVAFRAGRMVARLRRTNGKFAAAVARVESTLLEMEAA